MTKTDTTGACSVVHVTSVHDPRDPRIVYKECVSLARFYDVTLMAQGKIEVPPHPDISFCPLPVPRNRVDRMVKIQWIIFIRLLFSKFKIIHIHDPELLPLSLFFRALGKKVIYDIHEDYNASIRAKSYLPGFAGAAAGWAVDALEKAAYRTCGSIIAERYYGDRFPKACRVLNYPLIKPDDRTMFTQGGQKDAQSGIGRLLYTGSVTEERGAELYAGIVKEIDDVEVWLLGRCDAKLAHRLWKKLGPKSDRLKIIGVGRYVPHAEMHEIIKSKSWLAGLAVFPYDPFYCRKEPTKFYEYMRMGMPIIVSDFAVWRNIIELNNIGLAVSPDDKTALPRAVKWVMDHPEAVRKMGDRASRLVHEKYSWTSQEKTLLDFYETLL